MFCRAAAEQLTSDSLIYKLMQDPGTKNNNSHVYNILLKRLLNYHHSLRILQGKPGFQQRTEIYKRKSHPLTINQH